MVFLEEIINHQGNEYYPIMKRFGRCNSLDCIYNIIIERDGEVLLSLDEIDYSPIPNINLFLLDINLLKDFSGHYDIKFILNGVLLQEDILYVYFNRELNRTHLNTNIYE